MKKRHFRSIALICSCLGLFGLKGQSVAQSTHIDSIDQCLEASEALSTEGAFPDTLLELGARCYGAGDLDAASQLWRDALNIYESSNDKLGQSFVLSNLGILYRDLGEYFEAIDSFERSLTIQQEDFNDLGSQAKILKLLSRTYRRIGELDKAIEYLDESWRLIESTANATEQADILTDLGNSYISKGNYDQARAYYTQGLELAEQSDDALIHSSVLQAIGLLEQTQGNFDQSTDHYRRSLAIAMNEGSKEHQQRILSNLCLAHWQLGNEATALDHCETSLKLAQVIGNRSTIASAFNNLGLVHFEAGNFAIAEENAREAVKILEVLFDNIKADPNAQVALGETLITYNLLQRILVAQEKYGEALVVAEEGRAKASINLLSQRLGSTVDLSQLEGALSLADIQQTAKENNVTIVEYSLILESYLNHGTVRGSTAEIYIWVVHPSGEIDFRQVPLTSENEIFQDLIAHLRKSLGIPNRGGLAPRTASTIDQQAQLKDLYELLIAPVEALLPNDPTQQVVIIPQRELFSIPFAALQDEDDTYLIENHTLSVAPAAKIFRLTQHQQFTKPRQAKWGENSLILGNPQMPDVRLSPNQPAQRLSSLPGAEKEAESIAQLLETAALINDQATEAAVKQKLPEAQLIHFATHGLLEYGRPEASGIRDIPGALALTPDNQEDGLLTAAEILDLQLQANLVVLSACDTGRGTVTDDGVNGLSLSFIMAGAPSVVVSLWAVPDAPTAALMTEFYSQLQQGKNKSQALRQAMLTTMETHPDPRDWAAFILIGATD